MWFFNADKIVGTSAETKPIYNPKGSVFLEIDTGYLYIWNGLYWLNSTSSGDVFVGVISILNTPPLYPAHIILWESMII